MNKRSMAITEHHREGGWGWFVVLACFAAEFVVFGTLKALGVLITAMKEDLDTDLWIMGSITALHIGVHFTLSPVATLLGRRYGGRPVIAVGSILYGLGLVLASLTYSVEVIAIVLIGLAGAGSACVRQTTRGEIAFYFHDKFAVALFIGLTGAPIGVVVYGPLTQVCLDTYGWRGAMFLIGGLALNLVPAGALVRRPTRGTVGGGPRRLVPAGSGVAEGRQGEEGTPESKGCLETFGLDIFSNLEFLLMTGMRMFYNVGYNGFVVYMVPNALAVGLSPREASLLTTALGAGSFVGLVLGTLVARRKSVVHGAIILSSLVTAVLIVAVPLVHSFIGQQVMTFIIGVGIYVLVIVVAVLSRNLPFGDASIGVIYGWMAFFSGVASSIGDVLVGWIYEMSGSFLSAFALLGAMMMTVAICAVGDLIHIHINPRKTKSNHLSMPLHG